MDTKPVGGFLWMRVLPHVGKVTVFEKTSGLRKQRKIAGAAAD